MTHWQAWAVCVVVPLCAAHVMWTLIGEATRSRLLTACDVAPLPAAWRRRLRIRAAVRGARACACDGCHRATTAAPRAAVVQVHRRPR